ncbi:MAG: phosphoribosyltransferase [Dactylosporangium sp.]|nr:phosphoribosyltransferase [Dactylosporangium sp.]NNJ60713.1 phosphoribosyltransferase [Dactylosporangium sp.]
MPHEVLRKPTVTGPQKRTGRRSSGSWPAESERFDNRVDAGRVLGAVVAERLGPQDADRPLVLGLSRGGVVVAQEVAKHLDADLDVVVSRKVGLPWRPKISVGAIADDGPPVFDHGALAAAMTDVSAARPAIRKERQEIRRKRAQYRGDQPAPAMAKRTVVVADDGLAPSVLARAAVRAVRAEMPATIMYAAPVCAAESADWLASDVDTIVHLYSPRDFPALGLWYRDITPVTDDDVAAILALMWGRAMTSVE